MTRPEPVRADTFDLQTSRMANGNVQHKHVDMGFDELGEEEEDVFEDEHDDEDDDGDALSSSPSIPDDDIDFDFMYALHSFAATVEGQANATKGDMLVLLDDSNSYWWLVRIVKDHTVGYLPAETIETPQERLARLNKHRNIDLTAVMLEDHSPTNRQNTRKPFRRKGGKNVLFNTSCVYYQLEPMDDSSEAEDEGLDQEELITDGQLDELDEPLTEATNRLEENSLKVNQRRQPQIVVEEPDNEIDQPHPSPRIDAETVDVTDYGGRKVMRIKDLNEQVGGRPTSAIFRDSKLEPLKISVTPSIARDRTSLGQLSPDPLTSPTFVTSESEKDERKRSHSNGSSGLSEYGGEKERDRKGRKNSVFGNLFKKRTKKSKDEDSSQDLDSSDTKSELVGSRSGSAATYTNGDVKSDRPESSRNVDQPDIFVVGPGSEDLANDLSFPGVEPTEEELSRSANLPDSQEQRDSVSNPRESPGTATVSSTLPTPSLPWSDASLSSFFEHDTTIRDAVVLIHEGGRLLKKSDNASINPQIADLYSICTIHIEEMSSHLDDVLMSYLFDAKK